MWKMMEGHSILDSIKHIGTRYNCPVCGWYFRRMLPFGIIPRSNAQCPRCGCLERHRLIWLYLKHCTNLFRDPIRLLHIAPEPAFQRTFSALPNIDYVSFDLCSPIANVNGDISSIPFQEKCFDAIICIHVLEHIVDDINAMRELFRVLKPSGWAILQSPVNMDLLTTREDPKVTEPEDRLILFGQSDHVRCYGRDYEDRLRGVGFHVNVDRFVYTLSESKRARYRILEEELWYCSKSN